MTSSDIANQKRSLRARFRARRRALSFADRDRADRAIRAHLLDHDAVSGVHRLAAYCAFDGEPDLGPLLAELAGRGREILLPVIGESPDGGLSFHPWQGDAAMAPGRLGIRQPAARQRVDVEEIDTVLMPLVAWDRRGSRLGMGAGYYDRLFAAFAEGDGPLRVGVAYDTQCADALPLEPWDVPLHVLVTESGWFTCPS